MAAGTSFVLGIISKRPQALQRNLKPYASMLKGRTNWQVIVCDDAPTFAENITFLEQLGSDNRLTIRHLSNKSAVDVGKVLDGALGRDVSRLFPNNFAGLRNLLLACSSALSSNIVYVDDDTSPLYDFFERYEARFADGWKLVPGGYEGHADLNAPALLYLISECLNELNAGFVSKKDAISQICSSLRGVPPKKSSFSRNVFAGGNLGVSLKLASYCPFLPTQFRIEDALYNLAATHLLNEDARGVFRAYNYREAYALTPLSQHERDPSSSPSLYSQLLSELKGSVIAKAVDSIGFDSFKKETLLSDSLLASILEDALSSTWSDFNMESHKKNLAGSGSLSLLSGEDAEEAARISKLELNAAAISVDELKALLDDFSFCLKAWPYLTAALEDEKTRKDVLDALPTC